MPRPPVRRAAACSRSCCSCTPTADIADRIAERNAIVLNLETAPKELTRRMLDFLSGVTYALGGKVKKVSGSTYIITPAGMDFMGDTGNAVESREKYF